MSCDAPSSGVKAAIVVLGCRVRLDTEGRLREGPLLRRVTAAATAYFHAQDERHGPARARTIVVASGGRRWSDQVEADVMARELARRGVPRGSIVRERLSMSTRENARFVAETLERRGVDARRGVTCVTCEWHLPRALLLFAAAGITARGLPVPDPERRWGRRLLRWGKERALTCLGSASLS